MYRRKQKRRLASLVALVLLMQTAGPRRDNAPGRGKGAPGFARLGFARVNPRPVWRAFAESGHPDEALFRRQTLMSIGQFHALLRDLRPIEEPLQAHATTMAFADKILLVFHWLVGYADYPVLGALFGTTPPVISALLSAALPLLAGHFASAIPNRVADESPSRLSAQVVAVLGRCVHGQRGQSGVATHLLVDYDGYIASFVTSVTLRATNSDAAPHFDSFTALLGGDRYVIGDRSYDGVPYVLSETEMAGDAQYAQWQREQQALQQATAFVARCRVLSAENRFKHQRDKHIACVFIICGWHNWLKERT
jgi:hypothetical protein